MLVNVPNIIADCESEVSGGGGYLRFGLVRDVPSAARDPNMMFWVILSKIGTHISRFFLRKYPFLASLQQNRPPPQKISGVREPTHLLMS